MITLGLSIHSLFLSSLQQSYMDWSSEDLSKWLEAVHIATYSTILQQGGVVKGADLQSVDDLLLMEIGVSDDFHRLAILQCVEELVQGQSSLVREGVALG